MILSPESFLGCFIKLCGPFLFFTSSLFIFFNFSHSVVNSNVFGSLSLKYADFVLGRSHLGWTKNASQFPQQWTIEIFTQFTSPWILPYKAQFMRTAKNLSGVYINLWGSPSAAPSFM